MYSPKIEEEQIKRLYFLKMSYAGIGIKKPMTEMAKEAINDYIPKTEKEIVSSGGTILKPEEPEVRE